MSGQVAPATHATARTTPYEYWAKVLKVVDGDTLDVDVEVGFEMSVRVRVRILGIDAPEIHGVAHRSAEYARGSASTARVVELLPDHGWVEIRTHKSRDREKYGRWICEVFADGVSIGEALVSEGLATALV